MKDTDTLYADDMICPHCGHKETEPTEVPWTEDCETERVCNDCSKTFFVRVDITVRWSTAIDEDDL
jgi:NADH pyrophosphatase NudC (nudix superfamily)